MLYKYSIYIIAISKIFLNADLDILFSVILFVNIYLRKMNRLLILFLNFRGNSSSSDEIRYFRRLFNDSKLKNALLIMARVNKISARL
jgi:hypothetical protein